MTAPLTPELEAAIRQRESAATRGPWSREDDSRTLDRYVMSADGCLFISFGYVGNRTQGDAEFVAHAREDVPTLLAEVDRLRDELAEVRAGQDPRLRCLLVKVAPDRDLYIGWSTICEMPAGAWTRAEALAYGFPRSRLDRADENGSSDLSCGNGHWNDTGFIAEQRGWLRRDRLGEYALRWLNGRENDAFDLLEPLEGETEVRR
ncbi:hypothetical protein ACF06P_35585 [Streptomyces sp. NPDC015684]|uniref:hypothetical protein n=1 Tax=Streptomyces sp. NPDC015684 TaxID=3364963 RepID=UPI0037030970